MNRKRKIYKISNEDEDNIEKTTKRSPNNYDKRKIKEVFSYKIFKFKIKNE